MPQLPNNPDSFRHAAQVLLNLGATFGRHFFDRPLPLAQRAAALDFDGIAKAVWCDHAAATCSVTVAQSAKQSASARPMSFLRASRGAAFGNL
jgi:hypothetical protein